MQKMEGRSHFWGGAYKDAAGEVQAYKKNLRHNQQKNEELYRNVNTKRREKRALIGCLTVKEDG